MCSILYTYLHIHTCTCNYILYHTLGMGISHVHFYYGNICGRVHVQWSVCYVGFWCSAKATSIKATLPVEAANEIHTSYFPLSPSPSPPSPVLPSFFSTLPPSLPPSLPLHQPGFDVNATSMNGRNALHYAADYGHVEVVKLLLEKGAKIDVSNIHVHVQSCINTCIYMYMYEVLC